MKKVLLLMVFVLAGTITYAGGYRVGVQGQRALAMGHTGVAVVNSAELGFFNPAGLVYLENQLTISAGVSAVFSEVAWQNESTGATARTDNPAGTPFYFNASYKLNENLALGLSIYTPYGSTVEWEDDWAGSHLVNNIKLQAIYIQPLVSYKIADFVSVGGGPIFVTGSVNFNRNLSRTLTNIDGERSNVTIDASGVNEWGWSAGALFTPTEDLRVGVNYRSEIIMNAEGGDADFENIPNTPLAPFSDTTFDAQLPLPAELTVGLSYELNEKWLLAFDFNRTYWGVYESLDIKFANGVVSENPRGYEDANTWRFGAQYIATDKLTLRAGYYLDQSPVQPGYFAPETPRNDSMGFTGGLSLNVTSRLAIDASFAYIRFDEVDASYDHYIDENGQNVPFGGTYKSVAFIPGLGVTYKL
ncbi:OmpP1/FadL family transporter [Salinimicrobium sediminilitoris]|uniref:OmpP1/FadL family transporter n=1 Tax=Salinimicrobium sediminilitoris TaxID=2876715 RepID=UPI001E63E22B|nr:outer membrane protein transport protein [Salinimicrobium sediminilitoris]MCC8359939.1 outer membrane protein transport protein [Salinimicrobium sediminilitoris]